MKAQKGLALIVIMVISVAFILLIFAGSDDTTDKIDTENRSFNMKITSPAFNEGDEIPSLFTCDGRDTNPQLDIEDIPKDTVSLALIFDDPDAPAGSANPGWVHWILYNINPEIDSLVADDTPKGASGGINDWGKTGYGGPCPHSGTHHYEFTVYALDETLEFPMPPTKGELVEAMEDHILEQAKLTGIYTRS